MIRYENREFLWLTKWILVLVYTDQPEFCDSIALEPGEMLTPLYTLFLSQWDGDGNMTVLSNKDL